MLHYVIFIKPIRRVLIINWRTNTECTILTKRILKNNIKFSKDHAVSCSITKSKSVNIKTVITMILKVNVTMLF